jgi:uncharacterized membrane protein
MGMQCWFYRRRKVMKKLIFVVLDTTLSFLFIKMGIFFYGYGFGILYFGVSVMALFYLNKFFKRLRYETFMFN